MTRTAGISVAAAMILVALVALLIGREPIQPRLGGPNWYASGAPLYGQTPEP